MRRTRLLESSACLRHLRSHSVVFDELASSSRVLRLLPEEMIPVRSILFNKTPDANWPVAWHQDLTIAVKKEADVFGYENWSTKDGVVHVQPPVNFLERMMTLRIHLDPTPEENGALRVVPGSSSIGRIQSESIPDLVKGNETVCSCSAGDVLLMAPLILHSSKRAAAPANRRIIHFEYAPEESLDPCLSWFEA